MGKRMGLAWTTPSAPLTLPSCLPPSWCVCVYVYVGHGASPAQRRFFDLQYALRLCTQHGKAQACILIYGAMGLYEEAVELALTVRVSTSVCVCVYDRGEGEAECMARIPCSCGRGGGRGY